ncbi:hypothetical protein FACS189472_12790 [Alphaproteobacteria bacterium]|nr:hypothetical protein FACS189472_12790 [Alphaproteobacteria bacterium]
MRRDGYSGKSGDEEKNEDKEAEEEGDEEDGNEDGDELKEPEAVGESEE